jgi:hypothetical protein
MGAPETNESTLLSVRVRAALERSEQALRADWRSSAPSGAPPRRWFAVGDPQTTRARFFGFLEAAGVLGDDGALAEDVGLLCVGDYFDFQGPPAVVAREGLGILRWLAAHAADRVVLLLGNHDVCRVMELEELDDRTFGEAQALGTAVYHAHGEERRALEAEFFTRFPSVPTPGLVARDFLGFAVAQRALLKRLLLARRLRLAVEGTLPDGTPVLVTHAGVTARELALLQLDAPATPAQIAGALQRAFRRALDAVEPAWRSGQHARLDLAPLHLAGRNGAEGGGLLYHRPAHPQETRSDIAWAFAPELPRRFDPSRALPRGLVQVCGHTGHSKCLGELGSWVEESARRVRAGGLRTLTVQHGTVRYQLGIQPTPPGDATLYLIDGEMAKATVAECPLLPLGAVDPAMEPAPCEAVTHVFDPDLPPCSDCESLR